MDILPVIIAAVSLIGSGIAFLMSTRERKSQSAMFEASATQTIGESYKGLIETLEIRVSKLEGEVSTLKEENIKLKEENNELRRLVGELKKENAELRERVENGE